MARIAGVPPVRVRVMPRSMLRLAGLFSPVVRELPEVAYQMERPFIIDSSAAEAAFGLRSTPWEQVLTETIAFFLRPQASVGAIAPR